MSDLDIYVSVAAQLEESGWSSVFENLDPETFEKIRTALDGLKDTGDDAKDEEPIEEPAEDDTAAQLTALASKMTKVLKALKVNRKRFAKFDTRMKDLESKDFSAKPAAGSSVDEALGLDDQKSAPADQAGSPKPKPKKRGLKRKIKSMKAPEDEADDGSSVDRKHYYDFGSRHLMVVKPSENYPTPKEAKEKPAAKLKLVKAHGYNGNSDDARQNLYVTPDGAYIVYFIAAICVVMNTKTGAQRFFRAHNDDITTICLDPREGSTLVASGQKDPKDEPGKGKDLPKIWIWDYKNMKKVKLIDNVCWGKIARLQWSGKSGLLYCICGDEDQTLKIYNPEDFKGKAEVKERDKCNTMREQILGFTIHPKPDPKMVDEMVVYGKRKFGYAMVSNKKSGYAVKLKSVSIMSLNKKGEKAFNCAEFLPDGRYVVGGSSGKLYVAKGFSCITIVDAHAKSLGACIWSGNTLITAGFDFHLKKFALDEKKKGALVEKWDAPVDIAGSDFLLQPKAMAYDSNSDRLYVGSKTNQVMRYEMKDESAEVLVDGHDGAIWGLATHPKKPFFITGGYDNAIKIWDAKEARCTHTFEFPLEEGDKKGKEVSCAAWSNDGKVIVIGTEDSYLGVFYWNEKDISFQGFVHIPPKTKNSEVEAVSYLRFSDDNSMLAAAHMDSQLYIYDVEAGNGKVVLQVWTPMPHVAAPTNVQFSADGKMVKTLTRDYEVAHWKLSKDKTRGKFTGVIPDPDKVKWADDPLIAGWDTQGLYQKGWDGTDLNDATLTSDKKMVASGDDYGKVRLHNYPAVDPSACHEYGGHAEFVVGVEFLRDDSQLITCGGDDMAIFQWDLLRS